MTKRLKSREECCVSSLSIRDDVIASQATLLIASDIKLRQESNSLYEVARRLISLPSK